MAQTPIERYNWLETQILVNKDEVKLLIDAFQRLKFEIVYYGPLSEIYGHLDWLGFNHPNFLWFLDKDDMKNTDEWADKIKDNVNLLKELLNQSINDFKVIGNGHIADILYNVKSNIDDIIPNISDIYVQNKKSKGENNEAARID